MNAFEKKLQTRLRMHPKLLRSLFLNPCKQTIEILEQAKLLEVQGIYLGGWINSVLTAWEMHACEGNEYLATLIYKLENVKLSPIAEEEAHIRSNLQRQRILASTPGIFPFNPVLIQESLLQILPDAESLADLPQFEVIYLPNEELLPLREELERLRISLFSRRYIENIFNDNRREAILSVLAHIAKNYPLVNTSRQAYALMLSLDYNTSWAHHPFCLRLIYNRFWSLRLEEESIKLSPNYR